MLNRSFTVHNCFFIGGIKVDQSFFSLVHGMYSLYTISPASILWLLCKFCIDIVCGSSRYFET